MTVPPDVHDQLTALYRRMAYKSRPEAPSDGFGHITAPPEELDLDAESESFARRWWEDENGGGTFRIGYAHHPFRPAMVCALEAAKLLCAGEDFKDAALAMLRMAIEELEKVPE